MYTCTPEDYINPWVYAYSTTTFMSLLGQFVIAFLYFKQIGSKTCTQDLLLRMSISDAILSLGQQLPFFYESQDCRDTQDIRIRCNIYNVMLQFGAMALCLNCFFMSFFSYQSFTEAQQPLKKLSKYSLAICFPIPLALGLITFFLHDSQVAQYTCENTGMKEGEGAYEFFFSFYVPLTIIMSLSLYYVVKSLYYVNRLKQLNGPLLQIQAAEEILLNMMFYPIIFVFAWGGYIVIVFQNILNRNLTFKWEGLIVTMNNSQGWMNAGVYIYNYFKTRQIVEEHVKKQYENKEIALQKIDSSLVISQDSSRSSQYKTSYSSQSKPSNSSFYS